MECVHEAEVVRADHLVEGGEGTGAVDVADWISVAREGEGEGAVGFDGEGVGVGGGGVVEGDVFVGFD